jgi:hypothetical protein
MEGLLLQSKHMFFINTTPEAGAGMETWTRLAAGFNSFEPSMNEEVDQTPYLDGDGFLTSTVTGGQLTLTFSGHRKFGDAAQDWIFSKMVAVGNERETQFRWELPSGDQFEGAVTIAGISGPSGAANAKGEIEVQVHFNAEPTFTPAPVTP